MSTRDENGFTLIEVLVVLVVFGILAASATWSFASYRNANDHKGSAESLVSVLRNSQQRAGVESRTYCVRIGADNRSWTVWRTTCGAGSPVGAGTTDSARVSLPAADRAFVDRTGATSATDVYFYRSGMASAGSLKVLRQDSNKIYTVTVEGLTGRVTSS